MPLEGTETDKDLRKALMETQLEVNNLQHDLNDAKRTGTYYMGVGVEEVLKLLNTLRSVGFVSTGVVKQVEMLRLRYAS